MMLRSIFPALFPIALAAAHASAAVTAPQCVNAAGFLPKPSVAPGTSDPSIPVQHVLIIMQENHSFDNYFGKLNQPQYYGDEVDGLTDEMSNPDARGRLVHPRHEETLCPKDPGHQWNDMHHAWNGGKNDGFVRVNGPDALAYFDQRDLPYYYDLANQFAIADRYFASTMTQTFPNRFFLLAGTSFGHVRNIIPKKPDQYDQPNVFDLLDRYGVSWRYYANGIGYLSLFGPTSRRDHATKAGTLDDYVRDLESDHFPQVAFVESDFEKNEDEHPNNSIQLGQAWVAERIKPFLSSRYWKDSVLFLTYDEGGGFYDHVPPPRGCAPDKIPPMLRKGSVPGDFAQYGFRVPLVAVSPYAKHHYVSHVTYDHTSILKFIETKFNLPAMTARDANADAMLDLFDFQHPKMDQPKLPSGAMDPSRACGKHGT